jgi:hypothetical protein
MDSVLGAQATDQREGFMKALVGENDDRILGFTMIGATAGEVMAALQTAMIAELPFSRLANAALAHPTMAEGLSMLFSNAPPRSVQQITKEPHRQRISRFYTIFQPADQLARAVHAVRQNGPAEVRVTWEPGDATRLTAEAVADTGASKVCCIVSLEGPFVALAIGNGRT